MTRSMITIFAVATLALAACDVSQKKPQTVGVVIFAGSHSSAAATPHGIDSGAPVVNGAAPAEAGGSPPATPEAARGERSTRLYGRGVSRRLQTLI